MKSFSLSSRLIAPIAIISTLVILGLSAAVFSEVYTRSLNAQRAHLLQNVQLRAAAESRRFIALSDRDRAARADLIRAAQNIPAAEVDAQFDRLFPMQKDGTRRSADFLYDGGRTAQNEIVYGMAAYIHDGARLSEDQKRVLIAAVDVVFDYGRTGVMLADNFYFFTPREDVVIFAPTRPDKLIYYRKTAPANLSVSQEEMFRLTQPALNPERATRCTGLRRVLYENAAKRLLSACVTPVDREGFMLGAFGANAPMEGFIRNIIDGSTRDTMNVIITADGAPVAHPGIATPGVTTPQEQQRYQKELDLKALVKGFSQPGGSSGVKETNGGRNIVAYGEITGPGWYFLMVSPKQSLTMAAMRSAADIFLLALVAVAVQVAALFWMLKRIVVRPLETLARRSRRPDEDAPLDLAEEERSDEIGELARSLSFERARNLEILRTLEARVRARTVELEAANEEKSRFLANMSHELRTPLNGIVAVSDMLHGLQMDARGREYADIIRCSAVTLERVVSDLLDFSKIEAGQIDIEPRPTDLAPLVDHVVRPFTLTAAAKAVTLSTQFEPGLAEAYLVDPHRLSQVLINIIGNAVKFTDQGSVSVRVRATAEGVSFRVEDTGVGFAPEVRDRLFSRFVQADTSITRRYGGTGLGLAICASLVRLMGGRIEADSTPGVGSIFEIVLPLEPCEGVRDAATEGSAPAAGPDARRLSVLLAEDHPTNQRVVKLILDAANIALTIVENGREAVSAFQTQDFDCILMDMQMPVMDGIEAIRQIRELETTAQRPRTPIICVSANALAEHVAASRQAGADEHLAKPFRPQSLLDALSGQIAA